MAPSLSDARQHALLMLGVVDQVAHGSEDGPRPSHDLLALAGELYAGLAPLDQAQPELVLELLDLHTERWLADRARLGRVAEMTRLGQGFEIAELPERDHDDKRTLYFL